MSNSTFKVDNEFAIFSMEDAGKFNPKLLEAFNNALDASLQDETIQALIITGTDKNFSQGLDLETMSTMEGSEAADFVNQSMKAVGRLLLHPIPVVSAVNGHAFGLGAMITLASDYAVMREDRGFFCLPEIDIRMNLIPSMNALVTFKLQGKVLRDVLLTGKRLGGNEAATLQVVDFACNEASLMDEAKKLPIDMMGKDRQVLSQLKLGIHERILPEHFA